MNNNIEIQRESIIEITGTQYKGYVINHQPLFLQHNHNAVLLLTVDGKEIGFLPECYVSLYAPAIDSGKYNFTVEVVKSEPDSEKPVLIVKITSELKNHSEKEIENDILDLVQNIVNGCAKRTAEYLKFIYSETVNVNDLLLALNRLRLIQKLHSCSSTIIESHAIKQNSDKYTPLTKNFITKYLNDLKADVSDILKKIQKAYNESLDIDDEEEYYRVQSEIRERRKKFRSYDEFLTSLLDTVTSYVNIKAAAKNIDTMPVVSELVQTGTTPPVSSDSCVIRTVDFDNPHNCTHYKPCLFILNELKYTVDSWCELYTKFLTLLYTDSVYSEILKGLNGKSLCGYRIDFADRTLIQALRKPIRVSADFFAEINLSAAGIIKRIKCLMELCSIDNDHMIIKYSVREKDNNHVLPDNSDNDDTKGIQQLTIDFEPVKNNTTTDTSSYEKKTLPTAFNPDTARPFVLKDALIEILLNESPEITKFHKYRNGISSKDLRELIKEYYGKSIGPFEISKLLMLDRTFQSVGKGCYILNETIIPYEKSEPKHIEHSMPEIEKTAKARVETVIIQADEGMAEDLTIESIIDVIKENSDNLQYEDGFGAYEVKTLLSHKGIKNVSEEQIEALMSECSELQEIEDGYYILSEDDSKYNKVVEPIVVTQDKSEVAEPNVSDTVPMKAQEITTDARHIILKLNGNIIRAYDYSDALNKVCEFSINCKPFRMARIAGQAIQIHGNRVFYRKAVPVDGYNKLSNGLQIITITTLSELQLITAAVQKYCQIDDDMIAIISK